MKQIGSSVMPLPKTGETSTGIRRGGNGLPAPTPESGQSTALKTRTPENERALAACSPRSRQEVRRAEAALCPAKQSDVAAYITVGLARWINDMGKAEIAGWKKQLADYPDDVLKAAWNGFQREYKYPNRPNVAELVQRCESQMPSLHRRCESAWQLARQEASREWPAPTEDEKARAAWIMEEWRRNKPEPEPTPEFVDKPRHVLPLDGPEREEALARLNG